MDNTDELATLRAENARLVGVLKSVRPFVAHFKGGWSIHTPATISTAELLSDIDTALAQTEAENA